MPKDLDAKVFRLISDFLAIKVLVEAIPHELEKRMVARHALVKLNSLLLLLPRMKNDIRDRLQPGDKKRVAQLEGLIARLRKDYEKGMAVTRDAMSAHALRLELDVIDEAWRLMCASTFGVLASDMEDIRNELLALLPSATPFSTPVLSPESIEQWCLRIGDPAALRIGVIYQGIGTARINSLIPLSQSQDAFIRAVTLCVFLRRTFLLLEPMPPHSEFERLFAEMIVNDYFSLWEVLFVTGVPNQYGPIQPCVLDLWTAERHQGVSCLQALKIDQHPNFDSWRTEIRKKVSAHLDPDIDLNAIEVRAWPVSLDDLYGEAKRVISRLRECARQDVRTRFLFVFPMPPRSQAEQFSGDDERMWDDQ